MKFFASVISKIICIIMLALSLLHTVNGHAAELPPASTQKFPALPDPIVAFTGTEPYQVGGNNMIRYKLAVKNYNVYPAAMFAPAPNLPPCGANTNSSRTWVEIVTINRKDPTPFDKKPSYTYIYGFCAFGSPQDLTQLWFARPQGQHPPSPVFVILKDRTINKTYVSNLVDIPPPAPTKPGA